jgi:hypothetical protein
MALSMGDVIVWFKGDATDVKRAVSEIEQSLDAAYSNIERLTTRIGLGLEAVGAAMLAASGFFVKAAADDEKQTVQLATALKSTQGAAGLTADAVMALTERLSEQTKMERSTILTGENMLLTFTRIGKDVFPQVAQAMVDLATKMNGGTIPSAEMLQQAAIRLGKAMDDPIAGMTALRRVGVLLTDEQENQIKSFMAMNDIMGAQQVILGEIERKFGGSAAAAAQTFSGSLTGVLTIVHQTAEAIGRAMLPALTSIGEAFYSITKPIMTFLENNQTLAGVIGFVVTALGAAAAASGAFLLVVVPISKTIGMLTTAFRDASENGMSVFTGTIRNLIMPVREATEATSNLAASAAAVPKPVQNLQNVLAGAANEVVRSAAAYKQSAAELEQLRLKVVETTAVYGPNATETIRAQMAYDAQSAAVEKNKARLDAAKVSVRETTQALQAMQNPVLQLQRSIDAATETLARQEVRLDRARAAYMAATAEVQKLEAANLRGSTAWENAVAVQDRAEKTLQRAQIAAGKTATAIDEMRIKLQQATAAELEQATATTTASTAMEGFSVATKAAGAAMAALTGVAGFAAGIAKMLAWAAALTGVFKALDYVKNWLSEEYMEAKLQLLTEALDNAGVAYDKTKVAAMSAAEAYKYLTGETENTAASTEKLAAAETKRGQLSEEATKKIVALYDEQEEKADKLAKSVDKKFEELDRNREKYDEEWADNAAWRAEEWAWTQMRLAQEVDDRLVDLVHSYMVKSAEMANSFDMLNQSFFDGMADRSIKLRDALTDLAVELNDRLHDLDQDYADDKEDRDAEIEKKKKELNKAATEEEKKRIQSEIDALKEKQKEEDEEYKKKKERMERDAAEQAERLKRQAEEEQARAEREYQQQLYQLERTRAAMEEQFQWELMRAQRQADERYAIAAHQYEMETEKAAQEYERRQAEFAEFEERIVQEHAEAEQQLMDEFTKAVQALAQELHLTREQIVQSEYSSQERRRQYYEDADNKIKESMQSVAADSNAAVANMELLHQQAASHVSGFWSSVWRTIGNIFANIRDAFFGFMEWLGMQPPPLPTYSEWMAKGGEVRGSGGGDDATIIAAEEGPELATLPNGDKYILPIKGLYSVPVGTFINTARETAQMFAGAFAEGGKVLSDEIKTLKKWMASGLAEALRTNKLSRKDYDAAMRDVDVGLDKDKLQRTMRDKGKLIGATGVPTDGVGLLTEEWRKTWHGIHFVSNRNDRYMELILKNLKGFAQGGMVPAGAGVGGTINITGPLIGSATVRSDDDIRKLAGELVRLIPGVPMGRWL